MTSRIAALSLQSEDPRALAAFWAAALGWVVVEEDDDGVSLAAPGTREPTLDLLLVSEPKRVQNRLHLDVRADGTTRDAELERLLGLGAVPVDVGQPPTATWTVLADPQGNEFCLLLRTAQEVEADAGPPEHA